MLNQTKRVFTHKSKSKIFITILCIFGLLFSWSCSCKNRVSDPNETPINGGITNKKPDETPTGTFSMSAATNNVVTSIVKESETVGDIKISFVSANNYDYTMDYTVEDSETDEAKKLTKADFQLANKVLTAKDSVATKVKLVDSSAGPVEKTIKINFTFKANDTSLKNNTQTLSVEVKLTHAQTYADDNTKKTFMERFLRKGEDISMGEFTGPTSKNQTFLTTQGTFDTANNTFTIKPRDNKGAEIVKKSTNNSLKTYSDYYLGTISKDYIASFTFDKEEGGGASDNYYSLTYKDITFTDKYECDITTITFRYEKAASDTWVE